MRKLRDSGRETASRRKPDLLDPVSRFCAESLPANSIYAFLHERDRLFPDSLFTDLSRKSDAARCRRRWVAAVMVLQRLERLSDREAVDRFAFDVCWRFAAGVPAAPPIAGAAMTADRPAAHTPDPALDTNTVPAPAPRQPGLHKRAGRRPVGDQRLGAFQASNDCDHR